MSEIELSSPDDFNDAIKSGVTLVDFNASWCAPCRALEPVIGELEKNYSGRAKVLQVDIDRYREIALNIGIQSIPTIIIYKEGEEKQRFIGLQPAEKLDSALGKAIA